MRTTLDIAADVLEAAEELARQQGKTVGEVISELARTSLATSESPPAQEPAPVTGVRRFPKRGGLAMSDLLDKLRDEDPG